MTTDNQNKEMFEVAQSVLAYPGMENLIVDMLTPKILEVLKTQHGITAGQSNANQYSNQPSNTDQPIPFPAQQPAPGPTLQTDQVISLVQALAPYLGPMLGLTPKPAENTQNTSLNQALETYGLIEQIKVSAQDNMLNNLTQITGTLTNRTPRDPAEVLGQVAKANMNNKTEDTNYINEHENIKNETS